MTTELKIKVTDADGQDVGRAYLSWLRANGVLQTEDNLQAFVAGWALHPRMVLTAEVCPSKPLPTQEVWRRYYPDNSSPQGPEMTQQQVEAMERGRT